MDFFILNSTINQCIYDENYSELAMSAYMSRFNAGEKLMLIMLNFIFILVRQSFEEFCIQFSSLNVKIENLMNLKLTTK